MKKKLLFLAMLLIGVGAWAQTMPTISPEPTDGQFAEGTVWHTIKIKSTEGYLYADDTDVVKNAVTITNPDAALWCVTGDETNGYKFYNKVKGASACLGMDATDGNARAKFGATVATNFQLEESGQTGYWIVQSVGDPSNDYWNRKGDELGLWVSDYAKSDNGSSFLIEPVRVETAATVDAIDTWYYLQIHHGQGYYVTYDDAGYAWYDSKTVPAAELDAHLWGFVGDIFNGVQVVNKATKKAFVSAGSGNVTMGDAGTSLKISTSAASSTWFSLKNTTSNNYLNVRSGYINHYGSPDGGSSFMVTECKETEVAIGATGYATFYSDQNTIIPEGVEAYVVSAAAGNSAALEKVDGTTLPAETGVVLKKTGSDAAYTFKTSADTPATFSSNLLLGTVETTDITAEGYVLAEKDDVVGFYKADFTTGKFQNKAGKAYLPASAVTASARFLNFDFGTETGVECIEGVEATQNAVIYDLAGRRVQGAQKGLYIVNGKVVIK